MSALALPAAPRRCPPRWPGSWAWADWPRCWPADRIRAGRAACTAASASCSRPRAFASRKACSTCCRGSLLDVAGGRPGQHADGGAGRPAPGHAAGRGAGGAPVARAGGVAAGGRHHRAAAQHPVLLQLFVWYGLLLRCPTRARPGSRCRRCCPIADWRCRRCGWLPQAASLIVAMLIAGWAIRRRRLATDGPAHRGHVLLIRVAPWLALAAQLLAWTLLPRPSSNCRSGADWACKAAGNPASNSPRWSSACRCSMPPISPTSCAPRCARCRRGWSRPDRRWRCRGHPAPRGRAQCRARGAAAANQCLALIKNNTLAIAIGYQDLMAVINTAITQTGLALEGISLALAAYLGLALALGGALSAWNARSARHGPAICTARAWANGRHCLPPSRGKAADAGRGDWPGRPCCWRRCSPPVRSPTGPCSTPSGAATRRPARKPPAPAGPPWARTCCCSARCSRRIAAPPWSPAPRAAAGGRRRAGRGPAVSDGHAPASPSPRWRLPPARCPTGWPLGRRGHRRLALAAYFAAATLIEAVRVPLVTQLLFASFVLPCCWAAACPSSAWRWPR